MNARRLSAALTAWLALAALVAGLAAPAAFASGGSYATAGTGTYAQSLWWLDFAGYSNAAAGGGGQPYTFTLPSGTGSLSTTVTFSGNGTLVAAPEPAWSAGGAFGHGAYNGLAGDPILYWLNQPGSPGRVALSALSVKDAAGNARSFALYAADGENTNSGESIVYTSTAAWALVDNVNYYAGFNGGAPVVAGLGTDAVTETPPTSNDNNFNGSIVLGTLNPTQASFALSNNEGVAVAVAVPSVTLTVAFAARVAAADQLQGTVGYTSPVLALKTTTTSGSGASASTGAVSVIGTNSVTLAATLAAGSASSLGYYAGSIACSNGGPGAASWGGAATVLPAGAGTSFALTPQLGDSIACTLTLTPVSETAAGTVYADANHDGSLDAGETGTTLAGLYVKAAPLVNGACQAPATAAAAVSAATGTYALSGLIPGSYCLTLTNSASLANTTGYLPPGWVGTEAPTGVRALTITASPPAPQNFGLYNGAVLNVAVFADNGSGGGSANDGVQDGGESGLGGIAVGAAIGGTVVASATTGATGLAALWLPATAAGVVTVTAAAPDGYLATGGSAGNTGGSYARPKVTFTVVAGTTYSGVAFGLVPAPGLVPNGAQVAEPGAVVVYAHAFTAGSAGEVTFATSASATPTVPGWNVALYLDAACSGQITSGDRTITAPIAVAAGQQVCVLVQAFVPAGAPVNAKGIVTLGATLAYAGSAAPAASVLAVTDVTTVATTTTQFTKQVRDLTLGTAYATANAALPGDTLEYQLTVTNDGNTGLAAVVVSDATPAYTTFLAATCPAALPTGITACAVATQPAVGAQGGVQWVLSGVLAPGAQLVVSYEVLVAH
jgi:uncharacterized repeat protein (TIGR01451 family)